ncbi:MAG: hypothetical protein Q7S37_02255 [bacterium]|nr:hypothetical protein [bacterium]
MQIARKIGSLFLLVIGIFYIWYELMTTILPSMASHSPLYHTIFYFLYLFFPLDLLLLAMIIWPLSRSKKINRTLLFTFSGAMLFLAVYVPLAIYGSLDFAIHFITYSWLGLIWYIIPIAGIVRAIKLSNRKQAKVSKLNEKD